MPSHLNPTGTPDCPGSVSPITRFDADFASSALRRTEPSPTGTETSAVVDSRPAESFATIL